MQRRRPTDKKRRRGRPTFATGLPSTAGGAGRGRRREAVADPGRVVHFEVTETVAVRVLLAASKALAARL
jgi:hypothetical protein